MKKIIFLMLLLPTVSFANDHAVGLKYVNWDLSGCYGSCPTVDGAGIQYAGVMNNKVLLDFDYADVGTDYASVDYNILQAAYGFQELDTGSFTLGFTRMDAGDPETVATVGYSRRGGEGPDYSIEVLDTDEEATLHFSVRTNIGITLDAMTSDGDTVYGIGFSWKVGNWK